MLDFVIAKAWGNYHAMTRLMDEELYMQLSAKGPLEH